MDLSVSNPTRFRLALPLCRVPPCPDPPVVCPGFGFDKIGFQKISVVRASENTFGTGLFGALEGTRDGCPLNDPISRRPVLPGPASLRRPAVPGPDPTHPWYVRVLDSTG